MWPSCRQAARKIVAEKFERIRAAFPQTAWPAGKRRNVMLDLTWGGEDGTPRVALARPACSPDVDGALDVVIRQA